jgi:magnesium transporter
MTASLSRASKKTGLPPGSLVHVGMVHEGESRISIVDYSRQNFMECPAKSIDEILSYRETETVTWVHIEGLHHTGLIESLGRNFDIHPLVLEDILNTHQRPKFEEFEDYLFIVLKGLSLETGGFAVQYEQISILVMKKFVFTFMEKQDELFNPVRRRLADGKGRFRSLGADYLAYVILDTIVDHYFTVQDSLDEVVESVEDKLLSGPTARTLGDIQRLKRELIFIRKSVSPLRELLTAMGRSASPLIQEQTQVYLRDIYDHAIRVTEAVDSHRDLITGMLDIYLSSISNKLNEVMKVLTVFASIFIPLTFIAGIYGMNFEYMPELKWKWAYPTLWCLFVIIPVVLLIYFKKKKWL